MQSELSSSQEFIRALKGSKDPPKDGGLLKVDLARRAWELESLFIPSKAEVIVEWALQSLLANGQAERCELSSRLDMCILNSKISLKRFRFGWEDLAALGGYHRCTQGSWRNTIWP